MGFTKLWSNIIHSSIWHEPSDTLRVWIYILALTGADGVAPTTTPDISARCFIPLERTREIILQLESPDPDSRSLNDEGRRIKRVDGGYYVINYLKYREMRDENARKAYMRDYIKEYRAKGKDKSRLIKNGKRLVNTGKPWLAEAEAEAEADKERIYKKESLSVKEKFGQFENVFLTKEEKEKVKAEEIENLSAYIASKGKKYKSHYATILNWRRKNGTPKKSKWG